MDAIIWRTEESSKELHTVAIASNELYQQTEDMSAISQETAASAEEINNSGLTQSEIVNELKETVNEISYHIASLCEDIMKVTI